MAQTLIWKYVLAPETEELELPRGAIPRAFMEQHGHPTVWVEVRVPAETRKRRIQVVPTGGDVPVGGLGWSYVGTCMMYRGALVWHLYVENEP